MESLTTRYGSEKKSSFCKESWDAVDFARSQSSQGKKIVFVSGNFNVIHPGHLRLLRFAKECGDCLIVGIFADSFSEAHVPEHLRLESMLSVSYPTYAFILREQPSDFVGLLKPDFVVKGKEHENQFNQELEVLEANGGKLVFGSGDVLFSSLDLLRKESRGILDFNLARPSDFINRHNLDPDKLKKIVHNFKNLRVLVVGDLIVDEYINCDALGMSQEDPTVVVTPVLSERFVGGAGIVAAHAAGLGAKVEFITVSGSDESSNFAKKQLDDYRVRNRIFVDDSRPTTLKQRYRVDGKTLLRVNQLRQHAVDKGLLKEIESEILGKLKDIELVIFSDFNYGFLPNSLVFAIVKKCRELGVHMVADSQSSSQFGNICRFKDMLLIKPTEREARLALHDSSSGLAVLAEKLRRECNAENICITLGAEGVLISCPQEKNPDWYTDQLPALNHSPRDTAGAGDSFLTCSSLALLSGGNIWEASYLGCLAAGFQVSRIGNIPILSTDILQQIEK